MEGDCVSPCRSANATDGSEPQQVVDWLETGRIEDEAGDVTEEAKSAFSHAYEKDGCKRPRW